MIKKSILGIIFAFILSSYSLAAGKTWTFNGAGNWSTASNWSPAGVPNSDSQVIADKAGATISLDSTTAIYSLTFGSSNDCTMVVTDRTLTISNDFTIGTAGYISFSVSGVIELKGTFSIADRSSNPFIQGSSYMPEIWFNNTVSTTLVPSFSATAWRVVIKNKSNAELAGDVKCKYLYVDGTLSMSSYNVECKSQLYISNTGYFRKGTGKIIFNGGISSPLDIQKNYDLGKVEVSNAGTTLYCNNGNNFTFSGLVISSGCEFRDLKAGTSVIFTDSAGVTVNGNLNLKDCYLVRTSGSFALTNNGTVNLTIVNLKNCSPVNVTIDASSGCTDLGGNDSKIVFSPLLTSNTWNGTTGNWSDGSKWSNGVPNINSNVFVNSGVVSNASGIAGSLSLSSCTLSLTGDLTIDKNLSVGSGVTINGSSYNLIVKRDVITGFQIAGAGNLRLSGGIPQYISWNASSWNVENNNLSYYVYSSGEISCRNFTLNSGNCNMRADYPLICNDLTLLPSSKLYMNANLTVSGNAAISSNCFSPSSGCTMIFNSGALQTMNASGSNMGKVLVTSNNTALSLINNVQFSCLSIASGACLKTMKTGLEIKISDEGFFDLQGSLILSGTSWGANSISLVSVNEKYTMNNTGSMTLNYVNLKGCSVISGILDYSGSKVNNLGKNYNIIFPIKTWKGANGNWSVADNWDPPAVPASLDNVFINKGVNVSFDPASGVVQSLELNNGCSLLFLPGINLAISDYLTVASGCQFTGNNTKIAVGGNLGISGTISGTGNITLNGNFNQSIKWPGQSWSIAIAGSSGTTVNLENSTGLSCVNLAIGNNSTFNPNNKNINLSGNLVIDGNYLGGTEILAFNTGSSTSVYRILKGNNCNLGNLRIDSVNTAVSLNSSAKFKSLNVVSASKLIDAEPGITVTVESTKNISLEDYASLIMSGASGKNSVLQSSTASSQFTLVRQANCMVQMSYVDIIDCNANPLAVYISPTCSTTRTANFSVSASYYAKTWIGGVYNNWKYADHWSPSGVPDATHDVYMNLSGGTVSFEAVNSGAIASFSLSGNGLLQFLSDASLTVNGTLSIGSNCTVSYLGDRVSIIGKEAVDIKGLVSGEQTVPDTFKGILKYAGNSVQGISWTGSTYWKVSIDNPNSVTLCNDFKCREFTITEGCNFTQGSYALTVNGNMAVNGSCTLGSGNLFVPGDFTLNPSSKFNQGSGITYLSGNLVLNNTGVSSFTKASGKIVFNKGGNQYINPYRTDDLGNLQITNANTSVSIDKNIRFTTLVIDSGASFKNTTPGTTITVTNNGAITVNGTLSISGSDNATTFLTTENITAGSEKYSLTTSILKTNISYAGIRNCSAVNGKLDATNNCFDLLGNDNANIYFATGLGSSTWTGGTTGDWSNPSNWSSGSYPGPVHQIVINTSNARITNVSGIINSLTLYSTVSLTLSGDLYVNSSLSAATVSPITINSGSNYLSVKGNVFMPIVYGPGNLILSGSSSDVGLNFGGASWNIENSNASRTVTSSGEITCKNFVTNTQTNFYLNNILNIKGNCTINGNFNKTTAAALYFNGGTVQSLSGNSLSTTNLGNLRVSLAGTVLSLNGSLCVDDLFIDSPAHFKSVNPGTTITVSYARTISVGGTFTLEGTSWGTSSIYLKSIYDSERFVLKAGSLGLTYVSIAGCSVTGTALDLSSYKVNNLGSNVNLKFSPRSWIGNSGTWSSSALNWDPPAIPNYLDDVIINKTGVEVCEATGMVNSLTIGNSTNCTLKYTANGDFVILGKEGLNVGQYGKTICDTGRLNFNVKGNVYSSDSSLRLYALILSGNTPQTLRWPGTIETFIISNTSATVTLANTSTETLACEKIKTYTGTAFQISSKTVAAANDLSLSGAIISDPSTTLILDSDGVDQKLFASNNELGNLIIDTGDPKTVNLMDSVKVCGITLNSNATLKAFSPGTTITVSSASSAGISLNADSLLLFAGSYDSRSVLKSSSATNFRLTRNTLAFAKFAYVDISCCDASSGGTIYIPYNCTKNTTVNIEYNIAANNKTWIGVSDNTWSTGTNWSPAGEPNAIDDIIITSGVISGASGTIASLTGTGANQITIAMAELVVNGPFSVPNASNLGSSGILRVRGNFSAPNLISPGSVSYLFLDGNSIQTINLQDENRVVYFSNKSSSGVISNNDLICNRLEIETGAKYNQGISNLRVLTYMTIASLGVFTQSFPGDVSIGEYFTLNSGASAVFGRDLFIGGNMNISGPCSLSINTETFTEISGWFELNGGIFNQNNSQMLVHSNFTLINGSFYQGNEFLLVNGNFTINDKYYASSGSISLSGDLISFSANSFVKGTGTVFLNKPETQSLYANNNDIGSVQIGLDAVSSTILLKDNAEFSKLTVLPGSALFCNENSKTIKLADTVINGYAEFSASRLTVYVSPKPDPGIKISSGKLIMMGTRDDGTKNYLSLLSKQSGSQYSLSADNRDNISIKYAKVMDCDASAGDNVEAPMSIDLGNNKNIYFGSQPPALINDLKIKQTVGSNEVKINWTAVGLENKTGRATNYIIKYNSVNITNQLQFDSSNEYSQNSAPLSSGNPESYTLKGLNGADVWYVGVEAKNFAGLQGDLSEIIEFTLTIDPAKPVSYKIPGIRNNISLDIPAGTFGQGAELTGKEQTDAQMPKVTAQPEFRSTGLGTALSVYPSQRFKQPIKLSVKYKPEDIEGLSEDKLKIAFYNNTMGKWYHIKSTCDKIQKSVSANLNHLTIFRVVEYTYLGLYTVKVFPNPWKVGTGGNFDIGEMTFKNLPEKGRIRIYNVAGETVKDTSITEANDGFYGWDGKNDSGNKVASGVYIVYIEDDNNNHRILKAAIIR